MSRLFAIVVAAGLLQCPATASAQQIGQNATGNPTSTASSSAISNAINPNLSRSILLPSGARSTASPSTVIVCDFDDLSGTYFGAVDVCSLGR
jgi:hypothetical protein